MADPVEVFLKHYGVKGMRWGFRRNESGGFSRSGARQKGSDDYETSRELVKRGSRNLSNNELQAVNTRFQLEKTYKELTTQAGPMAKIKKGNQTARELIAVGNNVNQVLGFVDSPAGRRIKSQLGG